MKLTFWGGAKIVTGASYLLESRVRQKITRILVDCGLYQGSKFCEKKNFDPFPYDPASIDAVLVTHSHIDHIGRIPQLFKKGFSGRVYSTPPTRDFAEDLLIDSENLLFKEATELNLPPLYDLQDVKKAMYSWESVPYRNKFKVGNLSAEFFDAGHILGSSFIILSEGKKRISFSGDLGNVDTPIVKDTDALENVHYTLIESTYGGRVHEEKENRKDLLEDIIEETVRAGGTLMIPAFAMERTQALLYELNELVENGRIPEIPVFIDSPLAIKLTAVYKKYSEDPQYFDEEALKELREGDAIFDFPGLRLTLTTEQSKEINDVPAPKVIIAGAGMSQGGRILHHEARYLSDPKSTILFIGYQAVGSLGRQILDGAKSVRIHRRTIPIKCRIKNISGFSAHADQNKLVQWLRPARSSIKKVFITQGEEDQSQALAVKIRDELALDTHIPSVGETVEL